MLVNPMPEAVYDAVWATATWAVDARRELFELEFQIVMVTIDDLGFAMTLIPEWFVAYNEAVEAGEAPILAPCPCDSF